MLTVLFALSLNHLVPCHISDAPKEHVESDYTTSRVLLRLLQVWGQGSSDLKAKPSQATNSLTLPVLQLPLPLFATDVDGEYHILPRFNVIFKAHES